MMSLSGLSIVVALLFLPPSAWSQQSTSPASRTELPTLQEAIYAAEPGAVLRADRYGPPGEKGHIIVDRPLTLIGGSYFTLTINSGPGSVFVRDAQVRWDTYPGSSSSAAIMVWGSDLLALIDCEVIATGSASYARSRGSPALEMYDSSATLLLVGSTFVATIGGGPGELTCAATNGGSAAVEAYGAVVYAWNSQFYGGGGIYHRWDDSDPGPCPDGPLYEPPAAGGPGLIAGHLWHHGSTFVGGPGSYWDDWPSVGPDGPPFVADWHKELPLFGKPR